MANFHYQIGSIPVKSKQAIALVIIIGFSIFSLEYVQSQNLSQYGPESAVELNGSNGYINMGNSFNETELPVTIEAWLKISDDQTDHGPVFVSQEGVLNTYYGFWLFVRRDVIAIGYGDGRGGNNPDFRSSKRVDLPFTISGRWVHIAITIRGRRDMSIYLNGVDMGGNYSGNSTFPMKNDPVSSKTSIGKDTQNTKTYWYKGLIDELRVWSYDRPLEEIRKFMCVPLKGNESELIGYWKFNDYFNSIVIYDETGFSTGNLINSTLQKSGAALGNRSVYSYEPDFLANNLILVAGDSEISLGDIKNLGNGIQFYIVDSQSQDFPTEINSCFENKFYVGIFHSNPEFQKLEYTLSVTNAANVLRRQDASQSNWNKFEGITLTDYDLSFAAQEMNVEYLVGKGDEKIELVNVITPNFDSYNDILSFGDNAKSVSLKIYNRWGVLVYENSNYKNNWSAQNIDSGVYYYTLKSNCTDDFYKSPLQVIK